jgi:phage tail-like protein
MRRPADPFPSFRFVLELGSIQVAGFQDCTGLQIEAKAFEYPEGGRNSTLLKFPDRGAVSNITLKRGVTSGAGADALFRWTRDVANGSFSPTDNPNRRPADSDRDIDKRIGVVLLDDGGKEVKRWVLFRAFPVKWTGPELKAEASGVAIETLELAHEGLELA